MLAADPVLAYVKLIAEPWDVGLGGYQLGNFPAGWSEWNDRYLDLDRERRLWQAVAGVALVALVVVVGGFVWLSLQHKTVPYIVEVDSLGAALAIKPVTNGTHPADERIVRYQLAAFVRGARQVMTDRIAMKDFSTAMERLKAGQASKILVYPNGA